MTMKRTAVVTGAAQGIGQGVATRLAALGYHVVLIDRDDERLQETVRALADAGHSAAAITADIAMPDAVTKAVSTIERDSARLDILINNAGISPSHDGRAQDIEDMALDEWNQVIAVNLTGAFLMCRAALPVMRRGKWGRIVNFSSQGGRMRSQLSGAHYGASKAGLIGFTRVLAGQVGTYGITANCIAPGRIDTEQSRSFGDVDSYLDRLPMGRFGAADDIAAGVEYLVSERASFVTGTVLDINGGFFMP